MYRLLLFVFFIVAPFYLVRAQGDIEKILDKAQLIYDENPAESYALCESAERRAQTSGDNSQNGAISICKARYLILIASFDEASAELNKAILFYQKREDDHNLSIAYSLKSVLLRKMGDHEESHALLVKVLKIDQDLGNTQGVILSLQNLTLDYKGFGDIDSMLYCLEELSKMTEDFDASEFYYYYQNWGNYYLEIEDNERAIQQFQAAISVAEKEKMTDSKATGLMFLSRAYRFNGEFHKADQFAEESYVFSEENNLIYESSEAIVEWIAAKKKLGDYKGALELQDKWVKIDKEIYDLEKFQKVKSMEGQLKIVEKEKEIAEGQVALKEANLIGEQAKTRNTRLTGVILIVVVLLFFTVFIYVRTRKLKNTIESQKEEVEIKSLKLEDALENIHDSLEYSKMIQSSMLPAKQEFDKVFDEYFILYKPKDIVSGDFYWLDNQNNKTTLAVGDCTGHGVPGAMVSMVCHEALNKVLLEKGETSPAKALDGVRDIVVKTFKRNQHSMSDGMDASLIVLEDNRLKFAGAYNSLWLFRTKDAELPAISERVKVTEYDQCNLIEIKADKQPVGHYHHTNPFNEVEVELISGDSVYLMSDGYADQFGGDKGKKLKASNLKSIVAKSFGLQLNDQEKHLDNIFEEWKGGLEQLDDVCIIGFSIK